MIKDYITLAFANLRHRGIRSWLTILGIFIGIAAVVSLISLGAGLQKAVTGQFSTLSVDKLTIQNAGTGFGPPGSTSVRKLTSHDVEIISNVPGVEETIPRLIRIAKTEYNKEAKFVYLADIPEDERKADIIYEGGELRIKEGKLLYSENKNNILIGSDIASEKQFGKEITIGSKLKINGKDFNVIGVLEKSSSFQINSVILMNNEDITSLLEIDDETDLIVVQLESKDVAKDTAEKIKEELRKDRKEDVGEEDFSVQTPLEAIASVNTILNIINLIVSGIAAISLLVGGIGIMNTMYTSVVERTREIGVMKAIGARNKDIMLIFLIESGLLGLVGGILGAIIGLGMAFGVSSLASSFLGENILAVSISWPLLIFAVAFSFAIGTLSGIMPAIQASRLNPVEALRK